MARCPAALPTDHTPRAGPAAVTVLDAATAGAAHRVFKAAAPQDERLSRLADAILTSPATPC